jgi:CheY-like chemotaxis protein
MRSRIHEEDLFLDTHSILVVDDEASNLNALERAFRREYNVFSAANGEDALTMIEENDIALVLADHRMPGMTGVELLQKTLQEYPDVIRIILTAYASDKLVIDAIDMGHVYSCISKPWEPEEIRTTIREWIEAYEVTRTSRKLYTRTLLNSGVISKEQLDSALQVQRTGKKRIGTILVERGMVSRSHVNQALKLQVSGRKRLGEMLVELGVVSGNDLDLALDVQKRERRKLADILVDLGYCDEETIVSCYALDLGIPCISPSQFCSKPELAELLPSELAYKYTIVPVDKAGRVLVVAVSEPLSDGAKSEIEEKTGYKVMTVCSSHRDIESALEQCYQMPEHTDFPVLDRR